MKIKALILACIFVLCTCGHALAKDVGVEWNKAAGATSYKIEISTDLGITWAEVAPFTHTEYTEGSKELCKTTIPVPTGRIVMVRVGASNAFADTWNTEAGIYFNLKDPPPTGFSAQ